MEIVIAGAGQTGRHLAKLLSEAQHKVTLIDPQQQRLDLAASTMDVATRRGSGTDWRVLEDLTEHFPELFLALTSTDEVNLVACSLAKSLGYPVTGARIRDDAFLNNARLDIERMFAVDHVMAPERMVAHSIFKQILHAEALHVETFALGSAQMRTLILPPSWHHGDTPLSKLSLPNEVIVGLIYRRFHPDDPKSEGTVIFPHGKDTLRPLDEVTFIGQTDEMLTLHHLLGISQKPIRSAMITGGSRTALYLAKILESHHIDVHIIEKDYTRCVELSEQLQKAVILHHDATDLSFLRSQRLETKDVCISCTRHDDLNMMLGLFAKECGCRQTIITTSSPEHEKVVKGYGITHTLSAHNIAANRILSIVHGKSVSSLVSMYDSQAEIAELRVSMDSKVAGVPLEDLGASFPKDFLVGLIQNRGRILVGRGGRILSPGDSAIVITHPKHLETVQALF